MKDLSAVFESIDSDIQEVQEWCDELYTSNFSEYFDECRAMFKRLQDKDHVITDDELSWILMSLPITLFDVSEAINRFKVGQEVIKINHRELLASKTKEATEKKLNKTSAKEYAELETLEYKILTTAYSSIIERAESEVSFARELIMSAKKIWDARRRTEASNPVSPNEYNKELPEYIPKTYIK